MNTATRQLFASRDYRLLWGAQTLTMFGSALSGFALTLLAYQLDDHNGARNAAAVNAVAVIAMLVSRMPASALADRLNRRGIIVVAQAVMCSVMAVVVVLDVIGALHIASLAAVAFVGGVAASFSLSAEQSALRSVVQPDLITTALGQAQARLFAAGIVGTPLGGLLFGVHPWLPFLFDSVSFGVAAIFLWLIRTPLPAIPRTIKPRRVDQDIFESVRYLAGDPALRAVVAGVAFLEFADALTRLVVVVKLADADVPPGLIGLAEAGLGVGGLIGSLFAGSLAARFGAGKLQMFAQAWCAVALIPIALTDNPYLVAGLFLVFALVVPASNTAVGGYVMTVTPAEMQGRMSGLLAIVSNSLAPAGSAFGAFAHGRFGGKALWCGSLAFALGVLPMLFTRQVRQLGNSTEWAARSGDLISMRESPVSRPDAARVPVRGEGVGR